MCAHMDARKGKMSQDGMASHKMRNTSRNKPFCKQKLTLKRSHQATKADHLSLDHEIIAPPPPKRNCLPIHSIQLKRLNLLLGLTKAPSETERVTMASAASLDASVWKTDHQNMIMINKDDNVAQSCSLDSFG